MYHWTNHYLELMAVKKGENLEVEASSGNSLLNNPEGYHDILPKDQDYQTFIKKIVRHRSRQAGYRRISTSLVESVDFVKKALGENSDMVRNSLLTFKDPAGNELALKPDATIACARAYLQYRLFEQVQPVELYYFDPVLRFVDVKLGSYRQFWQFGYELIGEADPALDAQIILLADRIFSDLGILQTMDLQVNNIGDLESRKTYAEILRDHFYGKDRYLSNEDKLYLESNPLRILTSENEDTKILLESAPKFNDYLSEESVAYHQELLGYLDDLGIAYTENKHLIPNLDYYNQTVFEFWDKKKGKSNILGSGGRYDGLIETLGGESTPGMGFAMIIERVIAQMKRNKIKVPSKDNLQVFVAQLGKEAKRICVPLIDKLRSKGIRTMGALGKGAIKNQIELAEKFKVPFTVMIGLTEVREKTAIIRDMTLGSQTTVKFDQVINELVKRIGEDQRDYYDPKQPI